MQEYVDYYFPGPIKIEKKKLKIDTDDKEDPEILDTDKEDNVYSLNPFGSSNAAFNLGYFNVGVALYFLNTPVSYYLITVLGISSTQYSAYTALIGIPWSFKFIFGMVSDGVPILKYKRKSWLTIGWLGFVTVNFILSSDESPSVTTTIGLMFLMTCLYLQADVCDDTLAVERSRFESEERKGSLQTSAYTLRGFGTVIGSLLGATLYNTSFWGWGLTINQCFLLSGIIPLMTVIPAIPLLEELSYSDLVPTIGEQFEKLWEILQLRAIYQTVGFIYFYGIFQVPNGAFTNFLLEGLGFTDFEYGLLTVTGCVLAFLGIGLYRIYFFETSWRDIYIYTTLLGTFFSSLQILLILQWNLYLGIPNFWFALGDTAITAVILAIQFMPSAIMFAMLCPEGGEGLVYAVLSTIMNLSGSVASDIGSLLTKIWDVSNAT
jgi:hypothetical protein